MEFSKLVKFIPEYVNKNGYNKYSLIKVEPKTAGKSIVSQLRASTMLNIAELPSPKDSKETRAKSITPICESKRVKIVEGVFNDKFLEQLTMFPNAKHDDKVDTAVYAITDLLGDDNFEFGFL